MASVNPRVAVIVLNWNNQTDTLACLESLQKVVYSACEVLVVDNGSTDGSVGAIKEAFPGYQVIETGKNLGFAGGNNAGIRQAMAAGFDYVFLLNNDTVVEPELLDKLVSMAESDPSIGIAGPKIFYHGEPDRLWFAGGSIDYRSGNTRHAGEMEVDRGQYDGTTDTDFISGCAMLIKRKVIDDIGLLYEPLFLYYEDSDFCSRAHRAGYRIILVPEVRIWHKVSSTASKIKNLQWFYGTRNMLVFEKRNAGVVRLAFFVPYYLAKFVLYNALVAAAHGDLKKAGLIIRAAAEGIIT